jgi:Fe-S oxidoreductase
MNQPHVALFVTCLVDLFRPSIGFAAVNLLERAGCKVDVPRQTIAASRLTIRAIAPIRS